eukprot:jgi/Phyca11/577794/estExt2_Genewise1.C_PHYCAscaffold_4370004
MTTKYTEYQTSHVQSVLDDLKHDVMVYGLCYIGGAFVVFISAFVQNFAFKYMAEKLTTRLRDIHFTALCRQNIGFFD